MRVFDPVDLYLLVACLCASSSEYSVEDLFILYTKWPFLIYAMVVGSFLVFLYTMGQLFVAYDEARSQVSAFEPLTRALSANSSTCAFGVLLVWLSVSMVVVMVVVLVLVVIVISLIIRKMRRQCELNRPSISFSLSLFVIFLPSPLLLVFLFSASSNHSTPDSSPENQSPNTSPVDSPRHQLFASVSLPWFFKFVLSRNLLRRHLRLHISSCCSCHSCPPASMHARQLSGVDVEICALFHLPVIESTDFAVRRGTFYQRLPRICPPPPTPASLNRPHVVRHSKPICGIGPVICRKTRDVDSWLSATPPLVAPSLP